jgi:Iap family predicted aminopeptidase
MGRQQSTYKSRVRVMVFNATFNNISVISWRSFLLVEETEYSEITTDMSQVIDKLYHIVLYRVHLAWAEFELTTLVVMGADCICSYKSNYHTTTTKTAHMIKVHIVSKTIISIINRDMEPDQSNVFSFHSEHLLMKLYHIIIAIISLKHCYALKSNT